MIGKRCGALKRAPKGRWGPGPYGNPGGGPGQNQMGPNPGKGEWGQRGISPKGNAGKGKIAAEGAPGAGFRFGGPFPKGAGLAPPYFGPGEAALGIFPAPN